MLLWGLYSQLGHEQKSRREVEDTMTLNKLTKFTAKVMYYYYVDQAVNCVHEKLKTGRENWEHKTTRPHHHQRFSVEAWL